MKVMPLGADFDKAIVQKKDFLDDLKLVGIDLTLIRRAIHHMTSPPHECHAVFFKTPKIEEIKESDPDEYKEAMGARKNLSSLLDNTVINDDEKEMLTLIYERIIRDYEIDLLDRKALLDSFRSRIDVQHIEDYKDDKKYPDDSFGLAIDKELRTFPQCESKLIDMLYEYIEKYRDDSSYVIRPDNSVHKVDYKQKDVFELIAEILNLRWPGKYDYETIRLLHRNYKTVKR